MKKILFCIFCLCIGLINLKAECLDSNVLKWAGNAKVMFETSDNVVMPKYLYYLYLEPSRDDIEITVTNDLYSGEEKGNIQENERYGIASRIHYETKTYTINVFMKKNAKACAGEQILQLRYSVPPYNSYSKTAYCEQNPEAPLCAKMSDTNDLTQEEFIEKMEKYVDEKVRKDKEKKEQNIIFTIIFDYLIWIIIPAIIVVIIYNRKIKKVRRIKNEK